MFFFTSKYSWVSLCPVLSRTSHELTKQTNMAAWWATMSLFCFGFTWKSLDTVTKTEDIQATQQLNSTNEPGDKTKAESQPQVFAGKSKRDRKYQISCHWLVHVHEEGNNTMEWKICCSFPKIAHKSSSLFTGNDAFRCSIIQAHPKSKSHLESNKNFQQCLFYKQSFHSCVNFKWIALPREQDDPSLWGINNKVWGMSLLPLILHSINQCP